MKFNFITLFPDRILSYFGEGLPAKAIERGVFSVNAVNLRSFSTNRHGNVDDIIYGGGPGMLLQVEPIDLALRSLGNDKGLVILTTPSGIPFQQRISEELADNYSSISFISGYYEGIDHRVTQHLVDKEISLGNYVLSAGDLPALCIADSVARLLPGFMGKKESLEDESHKVENILEYPQYTRPPRYKGWDVPEVLTGGNHAAIDKWREQNRKHRGHDESDNCQSS